ncbi:hypothetical protein VUR80DRAFT_6705 [Thermomyces stellatus]
MLLHHLPRHALPKASPLCPRCLARPDPQARRLLHRGSEYRPHPRDWPTTPNPTPYDIFNLPRDAPYSKARFYELAKLYHPDRHHCHAATHPNLTRAVCTERYRLVVLANDILSDPAKRAAYDDHGAGWTLHPRRSPLTRETYRRWRAEDGSAARNGTWEDWEAWHDARSGQKQEPVYMSHGSFAALLALALSIGIVGQANRAEAMAQSRARLAADRQSRVVEGLDRRAASAAGLGKEERVEWFIRDRENAAWGFSPQKWDAEKSKAPPPPPERDRA